MCQKIVHFSIKVTLSHIWGGFPKTAERDFVKELIFRLGARQLFAEQIVSWYLCFFSGHPIRKFADPDNGFTGKSSRQFSVESATSVWGSLGSSSGLDDSKKKGAKKFPKLVCTWMARWFSVEQWRSKALHKTRKESRSWFSCWLWWLAVWAHFALWSKIQTTQFLWAQSQVLFK